MTTRHEKVERFLALHRPGEPLVLPNPWDAGTAKLFASLGFQALATTSSGYAGTLGRSDGAVTREEALAHGAAIAAATELPVSADLENGFADEPAGVAASVRAAAEAGLAGCSVEDYTGDATRPFYDAGLAAERVTAAAEVSRSGESRLVLTARAENHLRGNDELSDTIARLQSYQEAVADAVYAPGLRDLGAIEQVVREGRKNNAPIQRWSPVSGVGMSGVDAGTAPQERPTAATSRRRCPRRGGWAPVAAARCTGGGRGGTVTPRGAGAGSRLVHTTKSLAATAAHRVPTLGGFLDALNHCIK